MGRTRSTAPTTDRRNGVRGARRRRDLTQAQLADATGVSRQTIVSIEAGGYAPSVYLALALADTLGETVESLFAPLDADATTNGRDPR